MIKQLSISNFQSHKNSTLDFVDGTNIIIGNSDSGKSTIIRALKWAIWNRPQGDSIRSWWGGKTSVELFTDDVHLVRSKDKEEEYILGDTHFKAFKTEVPKEIQDSLNMSETNLQQQLDEPYLLSSSSGEVAQHFNKIAKLDKIDKGLQNVNRAIREFENGIRYKKDDADKLTEEIKQFDHLDKFEADVEILETMDANYLNLIKSEAKLENLIVNIKDKEAEIREASTILKSEKDVNNLLNLYEEKKKRIKERENLRILIDDISIVQNSIDVASADIKAEKTVNEILNLYKEKNLLVETFRGLYKTLSSAVSISGSIKKKVAEIASLEAEFEKALPQGSVCPICNQIIK